MTIMIIDTMAWSLSLEASTVCGFLNMCACISVSFWFVFHWIFLTGVVVVIFFWKLVSTNLSFQYGFENADREVVYELFLKVFFDFFSIIGMISWFHTNWVSMTDHKICHIWSFYTVFEPCKWFMIYYWSDIVCIILRCDLKI